jgi:hypothetical protein
MRDFSRRVGLVALSRLLLAICGILVCAGAAAAQPLRARVTVVSLSPVRLRIEGEYPGGAVQWSFLNTYGGLIGLADRIHDFSLADSTGGDIPVRKLGPGEFQGASRAARFSYEVDAAAPQNPANAAHISWLNADYGYLMPADLLPNLRDESAVHDALLEFVLPTGWAIASSIQADSEHRYRLVAPDQTVFFVGRALRERRKSIGPMEFVLTMSGDWAFSDDEALKIAVRVLKDHSKHVGHNLDGRSVLMLAPLPGSFGPERWSAETRGASVVLLLGRNSSRGPLLGKLEGVLTHELFHLWVPNALPFDGDYDWFFEGFTLYQALRSAVLLGFIDFSEYLGTMARVYDSYLVTSDRDRYSLIDASKRRWTNATSLVYDKGMLAAFLCDLMLRNASENRRSLDDVYRELFRSYPPSARRVDGNEAIISALNDALGRNGFAERYVRRESKIELQGLLAPYGLIVEDGGVRTRLSVSTALNKQQREILRSLGYNRGS